MKSDIPEKELKELIEQSQDLNADSLRATREALKDLEPVPMSDEDREAAREFAKRRGAYLASAFSGPVLGAVAAGAALAYSARSASAASLDVQILQTAASIEVLAVATYQTALTLPFIGGSSANPVVKTFAMTTMQQHQQHQQSFNQAVQRLGGAPQNNPDPVLLQVVNKAKPTLTTPLAVVGLALELEEGAAETYVKDVEMLSDLNARAITASIMGVEAQHAAILRAVQALLQGGAADLIALPPNVAQLPAAAGSVGFPQAFFPTDQARPATEGAVQ